MAKPTSNVIAGVLLEMRDLIGDDPDWKEWGRVCRDSYLMHKRIVDDRDALAFIAFPTNETPGGRL